MPKATTTPEGRLLHIPAEAGYGVSEVFVAKDSLLGTAAHRG
jgi:hypothetical protein